MDERRTLHSLLKSTARKYPNQKAVVFRGNSLTYAELDELTDKLSDILRQRDVRRGDRVAIYVNKSLATIVSIYGTLKAGAAYVPLDPGAPAPRLEYIIRNSGVETLLTSSKKAKDVDKMLHKDSPLKTVVMVDIDGPPSGPAPLAEVKPSPEVVSWAWVASRSTGQSSGEIGAESDLAYILYTSGSTGVPKGVMVSHRNSLAFVNWAAETAGLTRSDVVANHAPIHFDLSTFDIFSCASAGATLVPVPEDALPFPVQLVKLIEQERITVWYSVPSALTFMTLYGNMPAHNLTSLRLVVFAGEVFPVKYLRSLMTLLPHSRFMNWYGPTETNVCTAYEVSSLTPDQTSPVPIGKASSGDDVFAVDDLRRKVAKPGEKGELFVSGPSVMIGYWGDKEKTEKRLVENPLRPGSGEKVYRTGDMVTIDEDGNFVYLGREDGMVKTRGYRVELGEIETALYKHPSVKEAVVLPVPDEIVGNRIKAVIALVEGSGLTQEEVKTYLGRTLPHYMVPEFVEFVSALPKTSTGKTDRMALSTSNQGR